jgi:hypothetical protein
MKNEIHLSNITLDGNTLIIREGQATKPVEPVKVLIGGNIDSPLKWLEKRVGEIKVLDAHVTVNRENRVICLVIDEKSPTKDFISGQLEFHPDFTKWGINTGEQQTSHELAEFIKMNRSSFKDKSTAMKLVTDLRKFTAKVAKDCEAFKDDRANYAIKKSQVVETNLPDSFVLVIPIFKGQKKETINVEISINPDSLACTLVSPEANDYIDEFTDKIIDAQIKAIQEVAPELVIIEM